MATKISSTASATRNFLFAVFLLVTSTIGMVGAEISETYETGPSSQEVAMEAHEKNDMLTESTLEQIHVITRHGSRTMLSRDADTLAEVGVATLTPIGQLQLYRLGSWLRDKYLNMLGNSIDSASAHKSLEFYNPNLHRFESSNSDRTLSSANALALALFPETERVSGSHNYDPSDVKYDEVLYKTALPTSPAIPVYTTGDFKNDLTLLAHSNCPRFHQRLAELYQTNDWISLTQMHQDILVKLAKNFPDLAVNGMVPLEDARNAYDAMHVARTECFMEDSPSRLDNCEAFVSQESIKTALAMFTDEEFDKLEMLTEHVEFIKYGSGMELDPFHGKDTAGAFLGSNLLWKILNRSKSEGDFFMYSTDEPTLFGLISTLQASSDFLEDTGGEKYFDYGDALIVEIHKSVEMGKYYFVLKYKANEALEAVNVVLRNSVTGLQCGTDHPELKDFGKFNWCMLDEVMQWAEVTTYRTEEAWCRACGNFEADVCLRKNTSTLDAWIASSDALGYTNAPGATFVICALFFGGFAAGILSMGLISWFGTRCREEPNKIKKLPKYKLRFGASDPTDPTDDSNLDTIDTVIEGLFVDNGPDEKLNDKQIC